MMRRLGPALGCALLLGVTLPAVVLSPGVAAAQAAKRGAKDKDKDKDPKLAEAKKLFDAGADAYRDGRYEDAVKAWEKSYELSQKPLIFESIANAYERLGDKKKAREYLAKWRAEAPKAEQEQLDERIKNLDARIAAEDSADATRKSEEDRKKADQAAKDKAAKDESKAKADARSSRLVLAIAVGGAGVLAAGAGVALDAVAAGMRPDAKTACGSDGTKTVCKASAQDAIETSNTLALAGDITWIAGAVLAAGGVALLVTLPGAPAKGKEAGHAAPRRWVSVAPVVNGRGGGIGVVGAF